MIDRRVFIGTLAGGLLAAPLAVEAQPGARVVRMGYLASSLAASPHLHEAFRQGLRDRGYIEGRNVVIEYRDAEGKLERRPALAAELVARKVDVIVAAGGTPAALAAKRATGALPIVFTAAADPVTDGLVPSLARPGGMSPGCLSSSRIWSASVWSSSSKPFRGSVTSRSSGSRAVSVSKRKRTC